MEMTVRKVTKEDALKELRELLTALRETPEGQTLNFGERLAKASKMVDALHRPSISVGRDRAENIRLVAAAIEDVEKNA